MGKSPGRWIKSVLFGKNAFKSNSSKGREIPKSTYKKAPGAPVEESVPTLALDQALTSATAPVDIDNENESRESRNAEISTVSNNELTLSSSMQDGAVQTATTDDLPHQSDRLRLEQAATKAQAAFRGYLARRAFRTLKGIIRLQAVIRGHLVRRQAVATLYCVHGIVKFQAILRGHMIRHSEISSGVQGRSSPCRRKIGISHSSKVNTYIRHEELLKNPFIRQLLSSSPNVMPLQLQYDREEPNSAWNWLLCWTLSCVWGPHHEPVKTVKLKQKVETQKVGQKRASHIKKQSANVEKASPLPTSESEKQKDNRRKALNQSLRSHQEHQKKEVNKVKHRLKKSSNVVSEGPVQTDVNSEEPKQSHNSSNEEKSTALPMRDVSVNEIDGPVVSDVECLKLGDKNEIISDMDKDFNPVEEHRSNENHGIGNRRASLPAICDDKESEQRGRRVRSYMAATESAKAKVRSQVSPSFGQDVSEKNGQVRRHSLPSSVSGKLSSSPRVQRLVQASDRGTIDRSLSSSRDGKDRVIQAGWKR